MSSDNPHRRRHRGSESSDLRPTSGRVSGWSSGSVCGGFELTLKGNCFATTDPSGWFGKVSDTSGSSSYVEASSRRTGLGVATVHLPASSGRRDRVSRLTFYMQSGKPCKCGSECDITYSWSLTPTMEAIVPMAANSGSNVSFYGVQRVTDPSQIDFITIGYSNCLLPNNPNDPTEFVAGVNDFVICTVPSMEPGSYNVSQRNLGQTGNTWVFDTVHNYKLSSKDYYDFTVVPKISSLNSNIGSYLGQIITITGSGFSSIGLNSVSLSNVDCEIWTQTATQIVCEVQPIAKTSSIPIIPWHSGLKRQQYSGSNHKTSAAATSTSSRLDGELYGPSGTYVAKLSGFFKAPTTGSYKFTLAGNAKSYLYMSTSAGSIPSTALTSGTPIAQIGSVATPYRFPWINSTKTISDAISLTAGNNYYFEAYTENSGTENLAIGVRIPNLGSTVNNLVSTFPDVQKVEAVCTYQRQKATIHVFSPSKGGYWYVKLTFNDGNYYSFTYSGQIPWGATAAQVQTAVGYGCTVKLESAFKNLGYLIYTLEFGQFIGLSAFSPTTSYNRPNGQGCSLTGIGAFAIVMQGTFVQQESPIFSGSFQVKTNSMPTSTATAVPVRGTSFDLANALRNFGKTPLVRVVKTLHSDYAHSWVVAFYGNHGNQGAIPAVDVGQLTGCLGRDPDVPNSNGRYLGVYSLFDGSSDDAYYDVIPNHYLRTASNVAQITVNSANTLANCPAFNCDYVIQSTIPTGAPQSSNGIVVSGTTYTFNLNVDVVTVPRSLASDDFNNITFGGVQCTSPTFTAIPNSNGKGTLSFTCSNPSFGQYKPKIHIKNYGYIEYTGAKTTVAGEINAIITNDGDDRISCNGGDTITLTGEGFPNSLEEAAESNLVIEVGGVNCDLISVSNTEVVCHLNGGLASCENIDIPVDMLIGDEGEEEMLSAPPLHINPSQPTLISVNPTKLNPVLQRDITLTGTGFDETKALTSVWLRNVNDAPEDAYLCDVKNPASETTITCFYLGLPSGNYKIYAQTSLGLTNELDIEIVVAMSSVTPKKGSRGGNTTLTITGEIFATEETQTLVYVGFENWYTLCDVISSDTNEVKCRTQPSEWEYAKKPVLVATRIQEEAICTDSSADPCSFTFYEPWTPEVNEILAPDATSGPFLPGDEIIFNGVKLGNSEPIVQSNGFVFPITSFSATQIKATVPSDFPPAYNATVHVHVPEHDGNAWFNCRQQINVSLTLDSVSPLSGASSGVLLTLTGNGFTEFTKVRIGSGSDNCLIRERSSTEIKCTALVAGVISVYDRSYTGVGCTAGACTLGFSGSASTAISSSPAPYFSSGNLQVTLTVSQSSFTGTLYLISNLDSTVIFKSAGTVSLLNGLFPTTYGGDTLKAGNYRVEVIKGSEVISYGSVDYAPAFTVTGYPSGSIASSVGGGKELIIDGTNFPSGTDASSITVSVCGLPAENIALSSGQLTIRTPAFTNSVTKQASRFPKLTASEQLDGVWTGNNQNLIHRVHDNNEVTSYLSSTTSCWIQLDVGAGAIAELTEFRYVPTIGTASNSFNNMILEGKTASGSWTTIYTLTGTNDGYNYWQPSSPLTGYRYLRLSSSSSSAKCNLAEVQYFGLLRSDDTSDPDSGTTCPISVNVRGASSTATPTVNYASSATSVLYEFTPTFGTSAGGDEITLIGDNFGSSPVVKIDDTECVISGVPTATEIKCITAAAPSIASRRNSIDSAITIHFADGNAVTNRTAFFYVDSWSSVNTWSGIVPPRDDDSVYIPAGQNVLVDVSPNRLKAVVIEGGLFFDNPTVDISFQAKYIMINGGRFQVGSSSNPIDCSRQVVITLLGSRLDPSLPIAGNKMIANINGVIDVHGCEINTPWAKLAQTANVDDTKVYITGDVSSDWKLGDTIVITSTGFEQNEVEERTLSANPTFASGMSMLSFTSGLTKKHYAASQTIGTSSSKTVTFAGEVGLLSRNVIIQGDQATSPTTQHGVNIISFSQGTGETVSRISNAEIRYCGQAYLVGRYAIYFRMIGSASKSYLRSNSIHHSYNRAVSIHATKYLRVQNNFIYQIMGHAVYLEDGIETNNQITGNLVANVVGSRALLLTDQIPACFYITNPSNTIDNNVCAGSEGQGFWFMLPQKPMGSSYCNYVCPEGIALGSFENNEAHTNDQNGLRIFPEWVPRTNPCSAWVDWTEEADPFAVNPSIQASINNFKAWKNGVDGIAAEKVGAILFNNAVVADNKRAGIEVADGRKSAKGSLKVQNSVIVGVSGNNAGSSDYCPNGGARGLVLPRTDFFVADTVLFHNFPESCMTAVETCSRCEYGPSSDSSARTSYLTNIDFSATVTKKLRYNTPRKDIVVSTDGSFVGSYPSADDIYLTASWPHLIDGETGCAQNSAFDGLICNAGIRLRRVVFWSVGSVGSNDLRVLKVILNTDLSEPFLVPTPRFSTIQYRYWRLPMGNWAFVAKTGTTYKYHWANGIDFSYLYFLRGDTYEAPDYVNLVNNHTAPRETYDVTNYRTNGDTLDITSAPSGWVDPNAPLSVNTAAINARTNGDWFHDSSLNLFWLILKPSLNGTFYVKTYGCKLTCPAAAPSYPVYKNDTTKRWCTPSDWTNNGLEVPNQGDFPIVESGWTMILDCNTARSKIVMIYGKLIWEESGEYILNTEALWVLGQFLVGNSTVPFGSNFKGTIQFNGGITASALSFPVVDLNKAILVTGIFSVYAVQPTIYRTIARKVAAAGDTKITVVDNLINKWYANDYILIESTLGTGKSETRKITSVFEENDGSISISFTDPLIYDHYGSENVLTSPAGDVDYRARVGLLSRKFTITAETEDNWGCRVYVTQYNGAGFSYRGTAVLDAVALENCGQANASVGALEFDSMYKAGAYSEFKNSVIRGSFSWLLIATSSNKLKITNNIFTRAWGGGVVFSGNFDDITFNDNWVTGVGVAASNNPDYKYVHWDANFRADGAKFTGSQFTNNNFSDCGGHCASIPGGDCYNNPSGPWTFSNNFIKNGNSGLSFGGSNSVCTGASDWTIYGIYQTAVGSGANAQFINVKNFRVLDAKWGFSINSGGQENVSIALTDSWIGGHANNAQWYEDNNYACNNKIGIMGSTSSTRAKTIPIWGPTAPWRRQFLEGAWLNIARFTRNTYFNWADNDVCTNNFVVSNNDYAQNSQAVHLFSVSTVDATVPVSNVFTILKHETSASLIKRCGGWECTGYMNVIFKDIDGTLTGTETPTTVDGPIGMTAFPKLDRVAKDDCVLIVNKDAENVGYRCNGRDWAILAFESMDTDKDTRVFSPVNITRPADDSNTDGFRNDLNAMMSQDDNYVDNWVRLARFYSIIQTNKNYSIDYLGSLPNQMRFQLQGATFDNDWVIVRQRYDQPYIISVAHQSNNSVIRSSIRGPDGVADFTGQGCGANYFFGVDQVVEFKLSGAHDCVLLATVTNGVKGRVRYAIDVNAFYANDGPTQFIDRVANVLGIALSSVRVVSVTRGSSNIEFNIATQTQGTATNTAEQQQIDSEISETIDKLQQAIANGQLNILNSQILDSSFSGSSAGNPTGTTASTSSSGVDSKIIMIAAALGGLVLIIGAVIIVKRMKKKDEAKTQGGFFDVKRNAKSPRKIGTRVFPLPKDLQSPSEKAPVIVDLESMTDTNAPKVGTEMSQRKFLDSETASSPANNKIVNLEARTKSRQQLKNPFE